MSTLLAGFAAPVVRPAAPTSAGFGHGPTLRVSVVVATCRRPRSLARCLHGLLLQDIGLDALEVIVVDHGRRSRRSGGSSTERLVQGLSQHLPPLTLRYLRLEEGQGAAAARNHGWRAARAGVVAFIEDGAVPDRDWLEAGVDALQDGTFVAVGGRVVVPPTKGRKLGPTEHESSTRALENLPFVGVNAFVRHRALVQVRGFDERFQRSGHADDDLSIRLHDKVGPVGRCENAIVRHAVQQARWGVSLHQQKNGFFDALMALKHGSQPPLRAGTPWSHYAIVALVMAALGLGALGVPGSAAVCVALAALLVLRLTARRLVDTRHSLRHATEILATSMVIPFLSVYWRLRGAWHFKVMFF